MLTLGLSGHFGSDDVDLVPGITGARTPMTPPRASSTYGVLIAAVEQERFNRIKHTTKFPTGRDQSVPGHRRCPTGTDRRRRLLLGELFSDRAAQLVVRAVPTLPVLSRARSSRTSCASISTGT